MDSFVLPVLLWQGVRPEMAPGAAAGYRGGRHALHRRPGSWNPTITAPGWDFHQWENASWKICQQGNNSASKSINLVNIHSPISIKGMFYPSPKYQLGER